MNLVEAKRAYEKICKDCKKTTSHVYNGHDFICHICYRKFLKDYWYRHNDIGVPIKYEVDQ